MTPRPLVAAACAGAALAPALASGCVAEAKVHNLRELHAEDGRLRYTADLKSDFEAALTPSGTGLRFAGIWGQGAAESAAEDVADPAGESLENLLELAEFDAADPVISGWQIEMAAWLAAGEASLLERERAVRLLGAAGARLGSFAPAPPLAPAQAASPADVAAAAESLARACGLMPPDTGGPPSVEAMDAAIARVEALLAGCDRAAARRLVRASTGCVANRGGRAAPAALLDLHAATQRRAASLALGEALLDREPFVRVAALEAAVEASEHRVAEALWAALDDPLPEVQACAARILAARGIPGGTPVGRGGPTALAADLPATQAPADPEAWLERLVVSAGHEQGEVAVAAALALQRLSGEIAPGLRTWEWLAWWAARAGGSPAADPGGDSR